MISQLKSIVEASEDRVRSPWFGSIVIAWIFINWQVVALFLFSKTTVEEKIAVILENHFSVEMWFIYPLGVAFAFTVISPVISFGVFKINHWFKVEQEIVKKRAELRTIEFESEIEFRKKRIELIGQERFDGLEDYSSKRRKVSSVEAAPE